MRGRGVLSARDSGEGGMSSAGRSSSTRLLDVLFSELNDDDLGRLAGLLGPYLQDRASSSAGQVDGWLDTKQAADYLGISRTALHKVTAARAIAFEQDGPGCKCWFKRSDLDAWRRGETADAAKTQPRASNSTIPNGRVTAKKP